MFLLKEKDSGITVSLNDIGFGVSQILPILVQSMLSEDETIIIEQPEIHIHPKLQAELGTLFAECIKEPYNNHFIIETHSENIILRLQKLIRKNVISNNDVAVIYVDKNMNGATCLNLRLDKNGNYNIKIGFAESRKDGSSNAKLANIIEYGKSGQVAKPFMKPAKSASKTKCIEVMKATFDKEVNNI